MLIVNFCGPLIMLVLHCDRFQELHGRLDEYRTTKPGGT